MKNVYIFLFFLVGSAAAEEGLYILNCSGQEITVCMSKKPCVPLENNNVLPGNPVIMATGISAEPFGQLARALSDETLERIYITISKGNELCRYRIEYDAGSDMFLLKPGLKRDIVVSRVPCVDKQLVYTIVIGTNCVASLRYGYPAKCKTKEKTFEFVRDDARVDLPSNREMAEEMISVMVDQKKAPVQARLPLVSTELLGSSVR